MKEIWLHKIWKNSLFDNTHLETETSESLKIVFEGTHNYSQGPDFLQARIVINEIQWLGSVEIHQKSSDWYQHEHQLDDNYNSVVLHVVWENDAKVYRKDGTEIPQLCIEKYVKIEVLENIQLLESPMNDFSCYSQLNIVPNFIKQMTLHSAACKRLQQKAEQMQNNLKKVGWEQSFHLLIAKTFGGKNNGDAFVRISNVVNFQLVSKIKSTNENLIAVMLGMSNFLDVECVNDEYSQNLKSDWGYLKQKYQLQPIDSLLFNWKCRPAQFPSMRLVQWAAFLEQFSNSWIHFVKPELFIDEYWLTHYKLGKYTSFHTNQPGEQFWNTFVLNCYLPAKYVWHLNYCNHDDENDIAEYFCCVEKESNYIVKMFENVGFSIRNGLESQGCIELYEKCCVTRNCHNCMIANHIIVHSEIKEHIK